MHHPQHRLQFSALRRNWKRVAVGGVATAGVLTLAASSAAAAGALPPDSVHQANIVQGGVSGTRGAGDSDIQLGSIGQKNLAHGSVSGTAGQGGSEIERGSVGQPNLAHGSVSGKLNSRGGSEIQAHTIGKDALAPKLYAELNSGGGSNGSAVPITENELGDDLAARINDDKNTHVPPQAVSDQGLNAQQGIAASYETVAAVTVPAGSSYLLNATATLQGTTTGTEGNGTCKLTANGDLLARSSTTLGLETSGHQAVAMTDVYVNDTGSDQSVAMQCRAVRAGDAIANDISLTGLEVSTS